MRYFEDFTAGETIALGSHCVTAEEIIAFAREFDPQVFHVDADRARDTPFGGLIASGWHTVALFMRLYVDGVLAGSDSQGSPGMESLRWLVPVRPGDELSGRVVVLAAEPSSRNPARGTVHVRWEMVNQRDETVMTMTGRGLFGRRPGGATA